VSARPEDWETLGLEPDADLAAVRRAYQQRRALYEPSTLATYSLLEEDERLEILDRIDAAYERISGVGRSVADIRGQASVTSEAPGPLIPTGPPPDFLNEPGACLRHHRLRSGLTLHRIAAETKIGVAILERIENENFEVLPASVFVRGHVLQFARELRIAEAEDLARAYVAKMQARDDAQR
jgi:flagellar biosynthesis protein FlhG